MNSGVRASDGFASQEVIRPSAILSEAHARLIIAGLTADDVFNGGHWWTRVGMWRRYSEPVAPGARVADADRHLGTVSCVYDSPSRYCVTVFRVSLTALGLREGWSVESMCDEAFAHAGITLASCPRATLAPPPKRFEHPRMLPTQPGS